MPHRFFCFVLLDFDFKALLGDPDGWTKTYDTIMKSLFDPWIFLFSNIDFILQDILPSRRQSTAAVIKFNKMLIDMAERRRQEIQRGEKKAVPDNEKDLLTLLIEADLEEGNTATNDELRVSTMSLFFSIVVLTCRIGKYCIVFLGW